MGDYWLTETRYARDKVDRMLTLLARNAGVDPDEALLYFCDGNHEHFGTLDPDADAPVQISDHVIYVPRGTAIDISGVRVGFCGGAESIDREYRTEGVSWWPEERMTPGQIARAQAMGPLDVLVTHDTSTAVFDALAARGGHASAKLRFGETERRAIDGMLAASHPAWHVHGHHHTWGLFRTEHAAGGPTTTVSLASDGRAGSVAVLGGDGTVHTFDGRLGGSTAALDRSVEQVQT